MAEIGEGPFVQAVQGSLRQFMRTNFRGRTLSPTSTTPRFDDAMALAAKQRRPGRRQ